MVLRQGENEAGETIKARQSILEICYEIDNNPHPHTTLIESNLADLADYLDQEPPNESAVENIHEIVADIVRNSSLRNKAGHDGHFVKERKYTLPGSGKIELVVDFQERGEAKQLPATRMTFVSRVDGDTWERTESLNGTQHEMLEYYQSKWKETGAD